MLKQAPESMRVRMVRTRKYFRNITGCELDLDRELALLNMILGTLFLDTVVGLEYPLLQFRCQVNDQLSIYFNHRI